MSSLLEARNVYEDFEVETDILFFKVGDHDLVIFTAETTTLKENDCRAIESFIIQCQLLSCVRRLLR